MLCLLVPSGSWGIAIDYKGAFSCKLKLFGVGDMSEMQVEKKQSSHEKKTLRQWLRHAFSVMPDDEFSEEEIALMEKMADFIVKRKLAEAAILFLETARPLNFVSAQAMTFLRPFVHMVFKKKAEYDRFTALLERRESIGRFIEIIESKAFDAPKEPTQSTGENP